MEGLPVDMVEEDVRQLLPFSASLLAAKLITMIPFGRQEAEMCYRRVRPVDAWTDLE